MDLEVVTVGTELLLGFTLDGNTADIGRILSPIGCNVVRSTSVTDNASAIRDAVADGLSRSGFVIVTGGLGPTQDDITKKAVAEMFGAPLELDHVHLATLEAKFAKLGRGPMPSSNRSQAEIPRGATPLRNPRGTAPGIWLHAATGTVVMLPGVPEEMRGLLKGEVVPRLERIQRDGGVQGSVTRSITLRTTGVSESRLAENLGEIGALPPAVTMSYLPGVDGVDLRLTVRNVTDAEVNDSFERAKALVLPRVGDRFYGEAPIALAEVLIDRLRGKQMRFAVAESCTGGMIGTKVTAVPGSSDVFVGGVICYENASKIRDLGVPSSTIEEHGAVSEAVVVAMVEGVRTRFEVDAGVAVTGVAGPEGGTPEKPVGTVWLAACAGTTTRVVKRWLPGKRSEVRERSAQGALDLLRGILDDR